MIGKHFVDRLEIIPRLQEFLALKKGHGLGIGLLDLFGVETSFYLKLLEPPFLGVRQGLPLFLGLGRTLTDVAFHLRVFGDLDRALKKFGRFVEFPLIVKFLALFVIFAGFFFALLIAFVLFLLLDLHVRFFDLFFGTVDEAFQVDEKTVFRFLFSDGRIVLLGVA